MSSYHIGEAHRSSPMDTAPSAFSLQPRPSLEYTASHSSCGKILNYHFQYFTIFTTFQEIICIERAVLGLGDYPQLINLPMATGPRMMANTLCHRLPITSIHERPVGNGGSFCVQTRMLIPTFRAEALPTSPSVSRPSGNRTNPW